VIENNPVDFELQDDTVKKNTFLGYIPRKLRELQEECIGYEICISFFCTTLFGTIFASINIWRVKLKMRIKMHVGLHD
jgi:hypothetical protein